LFCFEFWDRINPEPSFRQSRFCATAAGFSHYRLTRVHVDHHRSFAAAFATSALGN
jgi:hypothetical protein